MQSWQPATPSSPTWPEPALPRPAPGAGGRPGPPPGVPEPLIRVGDDFEDEYPGASALATECYANLCRAGAMVMELHNQQTRDQYQLSPSAREILAIIEGAGQALEPSVIAERLLITTGSRRPCSTPSKSAASSGACHTPATGASSWPTSPRTPRRSSTSSCHRSTHANTS